MYRKIQFKAGALISHLMYHTKKTVVVLLRRTPEVKSIDESIAYIVQQQCSVCRFGEGEMRLMMGNSIEFQEHSPELEKALIKVIESKDGNTIICLPDVFSSLQPYKKAIQYYWKKHLRTFYFSWVSFTKQNRWYYNSFVTRPYISYNDYHLSQQWFADIKRIWEAKKIVIIEGSTSRLGVENDLFSNAQSIERILCPSKNAFAEYARIYSVATSLPKHKLILIALGPTATVLAFDLSMQGYQAIDIGHIDIEYEWFLRKAVDKIDIRDKHTNEVLGNKPAAYIDNPLYASQIIQTVGIDHYCPGVRVPDGVKGKHDRST
jgi:glycosyltransferase family protein